MLNLIPQPQKITYMNDGRTKISSVCLGESMLSAEAEDDFLSFCKSLGLAVDEGGTKIKFTACESLGEEAYVLSADDEITIKAGTASGQLYALQTLKQILFQQRNAVEHVEITDYPRHKIRGFMLDSGRYFFPVRDVKTIIRRMALHKMNFLHLHLTEDQGWRVEVDKYPLLTEIGSKRRRTNFNHKAYSGFYTKNDIREIVRYAHAFCIKVMPEFDIPGHCRSALACYSYLGCFDRKLPVADHWGVKHDVLCAGKESTYQFAEDIIDEFCELFPDEYFHIGGDEVPKHRWKLCPHCQQKMKEQGLRDEEELQCYFMNRIKDYLVSKGRQVFMWSWELENVSSIDSNLGFTRCGDLDIGSRPFIDTSTDAYYIDFPYGYISLADTANHKVYDGECLGVEATLWTEYVPDMKKGDRMSYPRIGAMCETAWNGSNSWETFSRKIQYYYSYLNKNDIGYADLSKASPNRVKGFVEGLLFEKRQLTWEGLRNLFDDRKVEQMAKKKQ